MANKKVSQREKSTPTTNPVKLKTGPVCHGAGAFICTPEAPNQDRGESHRLKALTPDDRKKARDALNALLDAPDDDKLAIVTSFTVQCLLKGRKHKREQVKLAASGELGRIRKEGRHGR